MPLKVDLSIESSQNSPPVEDRSSSSMQTSQNNYSTFIVVEAEEASNGSQASSINSPAQSLHHHNNNNNQHHHYNHHTSSQSDTHNNVNEQQQQIKSSNHHQQPQVATGGFRSDTYTIVEDSSLADRSGDNCVSIIHFNDCYNIEPSPQSSGAAGFLTAINQQRYLNPMILFSGDILSPSFMSTFTKGEQMIPVLNDIRVDCAVFGNHEFDYGVDNLIEFVKRTTFPWLLSNVIDRETSNQLGDGQVYHVIERSGFKFGLIGLIEEEWLSTLSTLDSSDVIYQDFVERGRELARWLKFEQNVDYVIALTHFRTPNDIRLADSVPEIDLVLGGHDHDYEIIKRPNCHIIKSGTDFREFSKITLKVNPEYQRQQQQQQANADIVESSSSKSDDNASQVKVIKPFLEPQIEHVKCIGYKEDENLKRKLNKFVTTIDEKMGKVLGQFNCPLDGRFSSIRRYETNLGNFVTDIMLASTHADLAILNSGTLRSDRIHPRGDFTMRDLFNILGYIDPISVLQASGEHIWRALENGVSQWPKLEGRFPQVSGCTFAFDPCKPAGSRINPADISIGDEPLDLKKDYKLTTKAYLASGKDGYDMLKGCKILVPGDESPDLTTSILNHFEAINIVKSNRRTHHRQSIICLSRASLQKILDGQISSCSSIDVGGSTSSPASQLAKPLPEYEEEMEVDADCNNDGNNNDISSDALKATNEPETSATQLPLQQVSANGTPDHQVERARDGRALIPTSSTPIVGTEAPAHSDFTNMAADELNISTPSGIAKPRTNRLMSLYEMEHEQCKMEPKIEGRIRVVGVSVGVSVSV